VPSTMSGKPSRDRPVALKILFALEGFIAFLGFASGFPLLFSPSGKTMGLSLDLLKNTPVGDFALVGLFFIAFYGILPALAAYGLWTRRRWRWTDPLNKWTGQHWGWTASVAVGVILILWIVVELILLGPLSGIGGVLQVAMTVLGISVLALAMLPSVRSNMKPEG
jgi:hypothetical protein